MPRCLSLAGVILALLVSPVVATAATHPAAAMRFTAPAVVDSAGLSGHPMQALACPSTSLCVAADDTGSVLVNDSPTAGAPWQLQRVDDADGFDGEQQASIDSLACPSLRLCVGVDGDAGGVLSTTRPADAAAPWHRVALPGGGQLVAIACPTTRLCLAAGFGGNLWVSSDPTGPARSWRRSKLPAGGPQISALACPSTALCLAGGLGGRVFVSTRPASGGASFHRVLADPVPGGNPQIDAIACSSDSWCVAADGDGGVVTSHDPAGPASAWARTEIDPGAAGMASEGLAAARCRASGLCAILGPTGDVWVSPSTGAAFAPVTAAVTGTGGFDAVACPSDAECLTVSDAGELERSATPASPGTWAAAPIATDAGDALTGVSCPTTSLCVAIDGAGDVVSTTTPSRPASWRLADVDGSTPLDGVSCSSTRFCAIADANGTVLTSSDPAGGTGAWVAHPLIAPVDSGGGFGPVALGGIACASARLCLTGDEDPGQILTTTRPTGPATGWRQTPGSGLDGAVCASRFFCVVTSGQTIDALTAPPSTRGAQVTLPSSLDGVSCTSRGFCAGVTDEGGIWRSTDPAARRPRWQRAAVDPAQTLGISCVAAAVCAVVDSGGRVELASGPAGAGARWIARDVDGLQAITAVSCPTASECVAVDATGHVVVGTR